MMRLREYQVRAMETCLPSCDNFAYMMLNLVGEVGELAGKVAKAIRKEQMTIGSAYLTEMNQLCDSLYDDTKLSSAEYKALDDDLKSEAGDILWQLAGLCNAMGWDLADVAECNLAKLAARKNTGTIITHKDH